MRINANITIDSILDNNFFINNERRKNNSHPIIGYSGRGIFNIILISKY